MHHNPRYLSTSVTRPQSDRRPARSISQLTARRMRTAHVASPTAAVRPRAPAPCTLPTVSAVFGRGFRSSRIDRDEQDARAAAGLGRRRHEPRVGQYGRAQTEHGQRLSSAEASDVLSSSLLHVAEGVGERQLTPHTQMSSPCGARAGRAKSETPSPHTAQRRSCADTVQAAALKVESTGCSA